MEIKKSEKANLESKKFTWILLGFILVLAGHFVAFEWNQYEKEAEGMLIDAGDIVLEEEIITITMPEKKTVPPPPQAVTQAEVLNIVEDDAEIEETTIVSAEDQAEFVEIQDDVPIVVEEPEIGADLFVLSLSHAGLQGLNMVMVIMPPAAHFPVHIIDFVIVDVDQFALIRRYTSIYPF